LVVLCKGTGSVDEVFKLAGFNVVSGAITKVATY
jgi:hypothetical protein